MVVVRVVGVSSQCKVVERSNARYVLLLVDMRWMAAVFGGTSCAVGVVVFHTVSVIFISMSL